MLNKSCSIIIVAHSVTIAKLVVDPDLAAQLPAIAVYPNRAF